MISDISILDKVKIKKVLLDWNEVELPEKSLLDKIEQIYIDDDY